MTVPGWLILNVYVLILTGTMLYFSVREKRQTKQNKSFIRLQGVNPFPSFYFCQCHNSILLDLFCGSSLSGLAAELLTYELDTLALVWFRLAE